MKLAVLVMAVAIAAMPVLSALPTSPERPMRTPIVKKISGTPPARVDLAQVWPRGLYDTRHHECRKPRGPPAGERGSLFHSDAS